jgi:hypothetical protein
MKTTHQPEGPTSGAASLPAAILLGVAVATGTSMLLASGPWGLNSMVAASSLIVGLACALALPRRGEAIPAPGPWDILMLVVLALASCRAFLWILYSSGDELRVLSPYNLGDLSFHIHLIRYLASGVVFWPESPILSGVPLTYPLGADLWNALLLLVGTPLQQGLVWTGLAGAALAGWALWRWGGAFAIAAFLFNGGLAGFLVFRTGVMEDFQSTLAWKNQFLTLFTTQRGLLYALPCGLLLMDAWRRDFFDGRSAIPAAAQAILYATMPLFSAHTFLFLSLVLAASFLFSSGKRLRVLLFTIACVPPATLACWLVTGGFTASSGIRWLPGWMQGDDGWTFWAVNFGLALPLLAALGVVAGFRGSAEARAFVLAGLGTIIACFLVAFAPWEWDNTKLLLWGWLACAPFLRDLVLAPLPSLPRVVAIVGLFFTGALSLVGGLDGRHGYTLASRSDLARHAALLGNPDPQARIAVEPEYNNPAILLGHPVVCGYEGHLWSHGLDYKETMHLLRGALARQPGWERMATAAGANKILFPGGTVLPVPRPTTESPATTSPTASPGSGKE